MDQHVSGKILIVEDDPTIVELLKSSLQELGTGLESVADGLLALERIRAENYVLIILDLNLPSLGGFEICKKVREMGSRVPILILSSRGDELDKVLGLQLGADDFVTKPFGVRELIARVVALLRRSQAWSQPAVDPEQELVFGELAINPRERSVRLNENYIDLSPIEFDILFLLASKAGRVFAKEELLKEIWGESGETYLNVIGPHVSRLRSKIEKNPANPEYIRTDWGVGYFFSTSTSARR